MAKEDEVVMLIGAYSRVDHAKADDEVVDHVGTGGVR